MAKQQSKRGAAKGKKKTVRARTYVVVSNKSYGKALTGKFDKFRWIITPEQDSITQKYGITHVRTSQMLLNRMGRENWDRSRDIKNDIVRRFFGITFPAHFTDSPLPAYLPGTLARTLDSAIIPELSGEDKQALTDFLPAFVAAEASGSVSQLKAAAQIKTLQALASDLERQMSRTHAESWWQTYIKANILLMQQGYIKRIEKLNLAIGETKFPDFCLVTHDNYIDILEIKKPDTPMLKLDKGRGNYFWDAEVAKAISQTENYIEQMSNKAADIRSYLLDKQRIDIKAVRPRGIILAGDARLFEEQKQRDDFRLLSQGIKSITVVTYDELLARLKNYIAVLRQYETSPSG